MVLLTFILYAQISIIVSEKSRVTFTRFLYKQIQYINNRSKRKSGGRKRGEEGGGHVIDIVFNYSLPATEVGI